MLGGEPRLRAEVAVAGRPRPRRRDDARDADGRRRRLPHVHGRRHRSQGVRRRSPAISTTRGSNARIVQGGTRTDETGYFVEPTLVETREPGYRLMCEEIFGPVVTAYVYDDCAWTRRWR